MSDSDYRARIIEFAESLSREYSSLKCLSAGVEPEGKTKAYYFIIDGQFDFDLAEKLVDFELQASNLAQRCSLLQWPAAESHHAFLGETLWSSAH